MYWIICIYVLFKNSYGLFVYISVSDTMDDSFDMSLLEEADFDRNATYFVPDKPCTEGTQNCAQSSLPRNLTLKPSHTLTDVSTIFNLVSNSAGHDCYKISVICPMLYPLHVIL